MLGLNLARRIGASTRPPTPAFQSPALPQQHLCSHHKLASAAASSSPSFSSPRHSCQRQRHHLSSSISTSASLSSHFSPEKNPAMPSDVRAGIEALHASKSHKVVVYATGGAAQALSWLLTVPGASNTVLEARVPYGGPRSWADALDSDSLPSSLASAAAAEALADAAYRQAAQLSPFVPSPSDSEASSSSSCSSSPSSFDLVGVGCACALATGRDRKGGDRVFVAARVGSRGLFSASLGDLLLPSRRRGAAAAISGSGSDLSSRLREREAQDALASRLLLRTLGRAVGCEALSSLGLFEASGAAEAEEGEQKEEDEATTRAAAALSRSLEETFRAAEDPISALLSGKVRSVELGGGMPAVVDAPRGRGRVYLSGSFNPLHEGHVGLLDAAVAAAAAEDDERRKKSSLSSFSSSPTSSSSPPIEGAFELSVVNADKGELTEAEVRRRVAQFDDDGEGGSGGAERRSRRRVVLTRAPLFEDKAALFGKGASFVVGVDTAVRLLDPKYYSGGSDAGLGVCMGRIAARGARVFVAGRKVRRKKVVVEKTGGDGDGGGDGGGSEGEKIEEHFVTLGSSGALDASPAAKVVASLGLFREIPEDKFREDISSTELRERAKKEAAAKAAAAAAAAAKQ